MDPADSVRLPSTSSSKENVPSLDVLNSAKRDAVIVTLHLALSWTTIDARSPTVSTSHPKDARLVPMIWWLEVGVAVNLKEKYAWSANLTNFLELMDSATKKMSIASTTRREAALNAVTPSSSTSTTTAKPSCQVASIKTNSAPPATPPSHLKTANASSMGVSNIQRKDAKFVTKSWNF